MVGREGGGGLGVQTLWAPTSCFKSAIAFFVARPTCVCACCVCVLCAFASVCARTRHAPLKFGDAGIIENSNRCSPLASIMVCALAARRPVPG